MLDREIAEPMEVSILRQEGADAVLPADWHDLGIFHSSQPHSEAASAVVAVSLVRHGRRVTVQGRDLVTPFPKRRWDAAHPRSSSALHLTRIPAPFGAEPK